MKSRRAGWEDRPKWGGCHEWTGATNGNQPNGQPTANINGKKSISVRRIVWESLIGELPSNRLITMECKNPRCIWVGHMVVSDGFYEHNGYIETTAGGKKHHRVIMEEHLGRKLLPKENIHHINGISWDNRLENLELWSTSQPPGQRVVDKLGWAHELIRTYEPDYEAEEWW